MVSVKGASTGWGSGMQMPVELEKIIDDLSRAMVADILDSSSPEEIRQLIEEMEAMARHRQLH